MKASFYILSLLVALTFGMKLFPTVSAQQDDELPFKTAINHSGWELPGQRGSRLLTRTQLPASGDIAGRVFLSILKPKDGTLLLEQRAHYYAQKDGTLLVQPIAIRTRSIRRYDVEGKPFGYVYLGGGVRIINTADNRKLSVALGCSGGVAYYDEDGDGVFERLDLLLGTVGFKPRIPTWVAQYVPATPQHNKRLQRTGISLSPIDSLPLAHLSPGR
jgi:hypothetical protein